MPIEISPDYAWFSGAVLIPLPTRVLWAAQTGGMNCEHPVIEGIMLVAYLPDPIPHVGCWGGPMTDAEVAQCEKYLDEVATFMPFKFDRSRQGESQEAWWPIIVTSRITPDDPYAFTDSTFEPFYGHEAWLVTQNCD